MNVPPGMELSTGHEASATKCARRGFRAQSSISSLPPAMKPAMKEDKEALSTSPATIGSNTCTGDHCYAHTAIQWKDNFSSCTRNVKIGVIDTGFDLHHPALKNQKIAPRSFLPAGKSAAAAWHGTGVLALLAGRRDSGTPGLAPDASYHAASIFYADEGGDPVTDTVSFLKALDWMSDSGVRLVNMSFTGPQDALVQKKIETLSARGLVFAAAAGNEGPTAAGLSGGLSAGHRSNGCDQGFKELPIRQSRRAHRCRSAGCRYLDGVAKFEGRLSLRHLVRLALRYGCSGSLSAIGAARPG